MRRAVAKVLEEWDDVFFDGDYGHLLDDIVDALASGSEPAGTGEGPDDEAAEWFRKGWMAGNAAEPLHTEPDAWGVQITWGNGAVSPPTELYAEREHAEAYIRRAIRPPVTAIPVSVYFGAPASEPSREPTDSERLDWLGGHGMDIREYIRGEGFAYVLKYLDDEGGSHEATGASLREAIDAARLSTPTPEPEEASNG